MCKCVSKYLLLASPEDSPLLSCLGMFGGADSVYPVCMFPLQTARPVCAIGEVWSPRPEEGLVNTGSGVPTQARIQHWAPPPRVPPQNTSPSRLKGTWCDMQLSSKSFLSPVLGPHLLVLRARLFLTLCSRITSIRIQGTMYDARDRTQVDPVQGERPTCCATAPTSQFCIFKYF